MKIVILCALEEELAQIKKELKQNGEVKEVNTTDLDYVVGNIGEHEVYTLKTGMGAALAGALTLDTKKRFTPDIMVFCGIAGAYDESLNVGDVVIASKVFDAESKTYAKTIPNLMFSNKSIRVKPDSEISPYFFSLYEKTKFSAQKEFKVSNGAILSSDHFPTPDPKIVEEVRKELKMADDILKAADMESAAFAKTLETTSIVKRPCYFVVRGISNPVDSSNLPDDAMGVAGKNAAKVTFSILREYLLEHQNVKQIGEQNAAANSPRLFNAAIGDNCSVKKKKSCCDNFRCVLL